MRAATAEIFNARYKAITDPLTKDENGFVGTGAAEQLENMMVHFLMAFNGITKEDATARRKKAVEEYRDQKTQEAIAQVWP